MIDAYCKFVNDMVHGEDDFKTADNKEIFQSKTMMESIHTDISNILTEHTQSIDENAYSSQKISVNCTGEIPNTPFYMESSKKRFDWFGKEIIDDCSDEPEWGCCYDVMQLSNIKLVAVNSSVLQDTGKMYNKIKQHVESKVQLNISGNKDIQDYQNAIQKSESTSINNIKTILDKAISMEVGSDQSITIESSAPLKCVQRCGEMPSAGSVNQNTQIEIYSKNIASTVLSDIQKNHDSMSISTDLEFTDTSDTKNMIFISLTIFIIIVFLSDLGILTYLAYKMRGATPALVIIAVVTGSLISSFTAFLLKPLSLIFIPFVSILVLVFIIGIFAPRMDLDLGTL